MNLTSHGIMPVISAASIRIHLGRLVSRLNGMAAILNSFKIWSRVSDIALVLM